MPIGVPVMPEAVERKLSEVAFEHTGIRLGPEKRSLLAARVQKRLRHLGLPDFKAYMRHFEATPGELEHFINVITTNTTAFWRERDHFPLVVDRVARLAEAGQSRFRVWCGASSTGQEPYTLALSLYPFVRDRRLDVRILATDIDTAVLRRAHDARYDDLEGVPREVVEWGFVREGEAWRVAQPVREMVRFARLNLTRPPFPMRGPLDLIFVRNVMIYLDLPTRGRLAQECERLLAPGGLLFVGHSESLGGLPHRLKVLRPSVYAKARSPS